jgi:ABC-2 type transport system permease protein
MSRPGSLVWFARHELLVSWRDMLSMMTAGKRDRERRVLVGFIVFLAFLHFVAFLVLGRIGKNAISNDLPTLIAITSGIFLAGSAMVSQTMESVTRNFYSRSDLELILSSPVQVHRLFAVRIVSIAVFICAMSIVFIGPFVDVLAWEGGPRWLAAYGVIVSQALVAAALGVLLTVALFRLIGPKRTRLAAQICAAIIGAIFVIGLQVAAILSVGTISRYAFLKSQFVLARAPGADSNLWAPAHAALGDPVALTLVLGASLALFLATTIFCAPRFETYAIAAWSVSRRNTAPKRAARPFQVLAASGAMRRKEIILLVRDPWLMSQSLMQLLYLLPPALLLWISLANGVRAVIVLVPVLIMAAGQLAGGLAWLTISGEDAPDLVQTAPITERQAWRAKVEAVMQCVAIIFAPFVVCLLLISPGLALVAALGILASAASATAIQFWFRSQAKRSNFRRRHTSSRIATFSEAFSSITWAGAGAIAAAGSWLASIVALLALGILAVVRLFSPARAQARGS